MAGRHWGAVLILVPVRWYSWDFRVLADGRELAVIDRHWFHERATFTLDGTSYDVRRTGTVRGSWVLEQNDTVLAQATKPSAFRRRFEITFRHERYELASASPLRREFQLLRGGVPSGASGRRPRCDAAPRPNCRMASRPKCSSSSRSSCC